jgi:hypothetical protein
MITSDLLPRIILLLLLFKWFISFSYINSDSYIHPTHIYWQSSVPFIYVKSGGGAGHRSGRSRHRSRLVLRCGHSASGWGGSHGSCRSGGGLDQSKARSRHRRCLTSLVDRGEGAGPKVVTPPLGPGLPALLVARRPYNLTLFYCMNVIQLRY